MIVAERVSTCFGGRLVEPDPRENASHRLDAHGGGAHALVGNDLDLELRIAQMVLEAETGDHISVDPIVRQIADGLSTRRN